MFIARMGEARHSFQLFEAWRGSDLPRRFLAHAFDSAPLRRHVPWVHGSSCRNTHSASANEQMLINTLTLAQSYF